MPSLIDLMVHGIVDRFEIGIESPSEMEMAGSNIFVHAADPRHPKHDNIDNLWSEWVSIHPVVALASTLSRIIIAIDSPARH